MDQAFFTSKYFVISAVVACTLIGGAAGAYYVADNALVSWRGDIACSSPRLSGADIRAEPVTTYEDDGRRRTATYTLAAGSYQGGALDLCLSVGEILVEPSNGSDVELEVVTMADRSNAVDATIVPVRFRADGSRLVVGVWEEVRGESSGIFGSESAEVRLTLRVPASGAYDLLARNDVGDVRASGLLLSRLDAHTDVGKVLVRDVDLAGDATLTADVGDAILEAASVVSSKITLRSDVGNVEALLPSRADVGYDARAVTDVGSAVIRIGDTEAYESHGDGPGEDETARTAGFANKPTKVEVTASTDVGDARITTRQ